MFNPKDPNHYRTFLLYSGYVESQACSPIVISMSRNHGFAEQQTKEEAQLVAFNSMRQVFLDVVKTINYLKSTLSEEELQEVVWETMKELSGFDSDSWGGEPWDDSDCAGWTIPGEMTPGIVSVVYENAEVSIVNPNLLAIQTFELHELK